MAEARSKMRCRPGWSALELEIVKRLSLMPRFLFIISLVLIASAASAQPGHDACARDVSRFCRAQMNDGDQIVLACLKQNRARLSKACAKVLSEHGQ
jgi:hypothetical protein